MTRWLFGAMGLALVGFTMAKEPAAAERGRQVLLGQTFTPATGSVRAYETLWKQWGLKEKPADYARASARYGLHEAPYDNQGLPMGLRYAAGLFTSKGITHDCMLCHSGAIAGKPILGLGNASLELHAFFQELMAADGMKLDMPFQMSNARGTIEAVPVVVYLMQFRDPDLNLRKPMPVDLRGSSIEDVPAWWLLKRKKTMYALGTTDVRSVRTLMPFMLSPLNGGEYIKKQESAFAAIRDYILSLEAPKYPFAIDAARAGRGQELFVQHCAKCHGSYGPDGKYPNKHVSIDVVGTDRTLLESTDPAAADHYFQSWFLQERGPGGEALISHYPHGYQAPPLDGVWATAPYFHNASVPTLHHVLNSKVRPKIFTRSYGTDVTDYDTDKVGVKFRELDGRADANLPPIERRKIYDTAQPGRGNGGHPFGDKLTEDERSAVLEYLKTL